MFICRPIECKTMSQEDRASRREIAQNWWTKNGTRVKDFLKGYSTLSPTPPIPDSKIVELHKSAMDALQEEAKILASQVIAYEHVWQYWDAETCDKMYKDGMEINNALCILDTPVDMATRTAGTAGVAGAREERLKDPWYKWASSKRWGPHLPLTAQCLFSVSYHTLRDQRWRHLWEEDSTAAPRSTLGGNRSERMDAKIEAEEDAAAATMPEKKRLEFQWQRAKNKRDAAWRTMNREQNDVEQGVGSLNRLAVFKATLDKVDKELEAARLGWVEAPTIEATIS